MQNGDVAGHEDGGGGSGDEMGENEAVDDGSQPLGALNHLPLPPSMDFFAADSDEEDGGGDEDNEWETDEDDAIDTFDGLEAESQSHGTTTLWPSHRAFSPAVFFFPGVAVAARTPKSAVCRDGKRSGLLIFGGGDVTGSSSNKIGLWKFSMQVTLKPKRVRGKKNNNLPLHNAHMDHEFVAPCFTRTRHLCEPKTNLLS